MLKKYFPFGFIIATLFVLFLTNFSVNGFLTGWDNLQTELNNGLNLKRALFSVWQEYQGLGVLAGNAHAADIVRQIFTSILSFVLPINLIRQVFTFAMLGVGTIGVYFMAKKLVFEHISVFWNKVFSSLVSLFYLLNLSTVQTFYAPFEPFIIHFAFLPWLILTTVNFLKKNSLKNLLLFVLINILSISQSQVPTVFFVYLLVLFTILLVFILNKKSKASLITSLKVLIVTLIINAFWLLPFSYFLFTNSNVALSAKINEMATDTVIAQNKAFGSIEEVVLLKGFWFNNVDPNLAGNFNYMLSSFRDHLANPFILTIGYLVFAVILIGFLNSLRQRKPIEMIFALIFMGSITMLSINTPPFSYIDALLRKISILNEVLRFPFTKFSIIASLSFAVFFGLGVKDLLKFLSTYFSKKTLSILPIVLIFLLFIFVFPIFKGNLFYEKEKINIPSEYVKVFEYFKNQDKNQRIANFPQPTFWGWSYYSFGYGGSGFIWYGIEQPILDRAFDVWNKNNENYYWEASHALYSKDAKSFEDVLNKYQIGFIMVDRNIIYPPSPISLFTKEQADLLKQIPSVKKEKSFGSIDIYKVNLKDKPNNFVFIDSNLKSVNSYNWNDQDIAYKTLGNYITSDKDYDIIFPFRSLFSNKNQTDKEFIIKNKANEIVIESNLSNSKTNTLTIPSFFENEQFIQVTLTTNKDLDGNLVVKALLQSPKIYITKGKQRKLIYEKELNINLTTIPKEYTEKINMNVNGIKDYKIDPAKSQETLGNTFLLTKDENVIVFSSTNLTQEVIIGNQTISSFLGNLENINIDTNNASIEVIIPKISDNYQSFEYTPSKDSLKDVYNCDFFRKDNFKAELINQSNLNGINLNSSNSSACLEFYAQNLVHNQGYAIFIESKNNAGRSLHFWLNNEDLKYPVIDTYLDSKNTLSSYVIAPQEDFGRAYSFHLENISLTKDKVSNTLFKISKYPIPYNFIINLKLSNKDEANTNNSTSSIGSVDHPNVYSYVIKDVSSSKNTFLILSQSFDKGWKAYKINKSSSKLTSFINQNLPFIFGLEIKNHVLINNWQNGWKIEEDNKASDFVIVYIPQYFQFLGFLVITFFAILLVILGLNRHRKSS
ncbi:MAG: hypothetical protein AAB532_02720 [Patescibacteria group bacterium]